ncbi:MAG: AAA family ATPase [Ferruginibacter sp.]|nr:AAA family ATPase [Ferruginibacter sp.]
MSKKIVILGPESTGKSTLCALLAEYYKTGWVKEYAREYLLVNGTNYSYDNLLEIASGQIALEDSAKSLQDSGATVLAPIAIADANPAPETNTAKFIFIDTNMYVLKVWCEFVFGKCHHWILNQIAERKYDLYLLCDIDLPWVKDELREYPDLQTREILYHHYKDIMVNQTVPWVNINGSYSERLQKAVKAVDSLN